MIQYHLTVVRQRRKHPGIGGAPRERVHALLVFVEGSHLVKTGVTRRQASAEVVAHQYYVWETSTIRKRAWREKKRRASRSSKLTYRTTVRVCVTYFRCADTSYITRPKYYQQCDRKAHRKQLPPGPSARVQPADLFLTKCDFVQCMW